MERKINRASIPKGKENKQVVHIVLFAIDLINLFIHYINRFNKKLIIHTNKKQINKG